MKPKGKNIICGNYTGPAAPGERIYVHCDPPIVGKRIKIKMLTKKRREVLVLCEVVVIGDPGMMNLSQKKNNTFLLLHRNIHLTLALESLCMIRLKVDDEVLIDNRH